MFHYDIDDDFADDDDDDIDDKNKDMCNYLFTFINNNIYI